MMESLTDLTHAVLKLNDVLVTSCHSLLNINYLIVSYLLKFTASLVNHFGIALNLLISVLETAFEDFYSFLCDLFSGLIFILQLCQDTLGSIHLSLITIINQIKHTIEEINSLIHNLTYSILLAFETLFVLLYDLLCLSLRSLVLILQMFPYSIILFVSGVKKTLFVIGLSISVFIKGLVSAVSQSLICIASFVQESIQQVPRDAYLGLLIALVMYGLFRCHKSGHIRFPPLFISLCTRLRNFLTRYWMLLISLCCKIIPKRKSHLKYVRSESKEGASTSKTDYKALKEELERQKEQNLCIICQTEPKSVLLLPCRHMCLCIDCSNQMFETRSTCPLCRRRVLNPIAVYT